MAEFAYNSIPVSEELQETKGKSSFVAYAITINFILGAGVLGLPYSFMLAGDILSPLYLMLVSFIAYLTILFLVEAIARGDAWEKETSTMKSPLLSASSGLVNRSSSAEQSLPTRTFVPRLHISDLQIEVNKLCKMFVSPLFARVYELSIACYVYGSLWLYSTIFGSSVTSVVDSTCDIQTSFEGECKVTYRYCIAGYAAVSIALTLMDMKDQKYLQVVLTALAMVGIFTMVGSSAYDLMNVPLPGAASTPPYWGGRCDNITHLADEAQCKADGNSWTASPAYFLIPGFAQLCTAAMFSQNCHYGIPSLVQFLGRKQDASKVFFSAISTTMLLYTALSVTTSLYFGGGVEKLVNLNWRDYRHVGVRHFVVVFPAILVTTAFPLNAISLANNLKGALPDKCLPDKGMRLMSRLIAVLPPLAAALFVPDASTVLTYTGMFAFVLTFWAPCILFLQSKKKCVERWGETCTHTEHTSHFTRTNLYAYWVLVLSSGFFIFTIYTLATKDK